MYHGIDHAGEGNPLESENKKIPKFKPRLNQQKLSNKISFYYPFIKFIEDIDLTRRNGRYI